MKFSKNDSDIKISGIFNFVKKIFRSCWEYSRVASSAPTLSSYWSKKALSIKLEASTRVKKFR